MARVLVTGASGRSGRYVVTELIARGHSVRCLYRTAPGENRTADWFQTDLSKPGELCTLLEGCDAVIHLAAELRQQSSMDAVNVDATARLAAAAERHGVRYFGHASSIVVYGSPRKRLVDETTPRLDPSLPISQQYYAEPYMLDYARTKAAGEMSIEAQNLKMTIDFYRPAVVTEDTDLLAAGDWSKLRKIFATYRRTQFVTARDAAAAISHLMERGLAATAVSRATIEAYNIIDDRPGTYRSLFAEAYRTTGDSRFKVPFEVPVLVDMAKGLVLYGNVQMRYPLGMMMVSCRKLLDTGFIFREGVSDALAVAAARSRSRSKEF